MLSTFCRNCGTYYKIFKGQAVANQPQSLDLYGLGATPAPASKPSIEEARFRQGYRQRREPGQQVPASETSSQADSPFEPAQPLKSAIREISCTDCGYSHRISNRSTSSLCPRCGAHISLRDYQINGDWSTRIQTRGDVHVTKAGRISGVTVQCFNLIVDGECSGNLECDGDFIIRRHGRILGPVRCKRLIVEKRAEVDFSDPVHADEVIIDGKVIGDIHCKGRLTLHKRATLRGDISISSLSIAEGASHEGMVRMSSK